MNVLNFGRHSLESFSYVKTTQELFVSFEGNSPREQPQGELQQWSLVNAKLVHSYKLGSGWSVDSLTPSLDGHYAIVSLYHSAERVWAKVALLDVASHAFISTDLGLRNERNPEAAFDRSGRFFRLVAMSDASQFDVRGTPPGLVFDLTGRHATAAGAEFPTRKRDKLWVSKSSKATVDTHGLYYTDTNGKDYLIARDVWEDNYGLTKDGKYAAITTFDGHVQVWSTEEKKFVYTRKLALQFPYLAYDEINDRFLLGDSTEESTYLRALVRRK